VNREIFRVFRVSGCCRLSRDAGRARRDAVYGVSGDEITGTKTGKPTGKEQGASREGNRKALATSKQAASPVTLK